MTVSTRPHKEAQQAMYFREFEMEESQSKDSQLAYVRRLRSAGLSVIPLKTDGSKSPRLNQWREFQDHLASDELLRGWFPEGQACGIGIITGKVSGFLECIDIDAPGLLELFCQKVEKLGGKEILKKVVQVKTPREGSGHHILYMCSAGIEGNQKLAQEKVDGKLKTLIETRGEGGYVVACGSAPEVHPSKIPYRFIRGNYQEIEELTSEERAILISASRSLNKYIAPADIVVAPHSGSPPGTDGRPGDDFNRAASWHDILEPHGWRSEGSRNGCEQWIKPHSSNPGTHASTNFDGSDLLYVFSTCAHPFEAGRAYSKFAAYTSLNHSGDFSEAAKALGQQGYGSQSRSAETKEPGSPHRLDDIGNAERFVEQHGDSVKWVPERQGFFCWNGIVWAEDTTRQVIVKAHRTVRSIFEEAMLCQIL
jgi:hypothetical protein